MTNWLQDRLADPDFRRHYSRESLVESFLNQLEAAMKSTGMSRSDLARAVGCKPANITQIMRRTRNLTVSTMIDLADAVGLQLELRCRPLATEDDQCFEDKSKVVSIAKYKPRPVPAVSREFSMPDNLNELAS